MNGMAVIRKKIGGHNNPDTRRRQKDNIMMNHVWKLASEPDSSIIETVANEVKCTGPT